MGQTWGIELFRETFTDVEYSVLCGRVNCDVVDALVTTHIAGCTHELFYPVDVVHTVVQNAVGMKPSIKLVTNAEILQEVAARWCCERFI